MSYILIKAARGGNASNPPTSPARARMVRAPPLRGAWCDHMSLNLGTMSMQSRYI